MSGRGASRRERRLQSILGIRLGRKGGIHFDGSDSVTPIDDKSCRNGGAKSQTVGLGGQLSSYFNRLVPHLDESQRSPYIYIFMDWRQEQLELTLRYANVRISLIGPGRASSGHWSFGNGYSPA